MNLCNVVSLWDSHLIVRYFMGRVVSKDIFLRLEEPILVYDMG